MAGIISTFRSPTQVRFGKGILAQLGEVVQRYAPQRVFIVTDVGVIRAGLLDRTTMYLRNAGIEWAQFSDVEANPSIETVERTIAAFRESGAQLILALGGGSVMDTSKAVGILATNGGKITDYEGFEKVPQPPTPVIAVPTTAGTASEVTIFCVITDHSRHFKFTVASSYATMVEAVLDPEVTLTMPPALTAAVGMDTLTHAIESYVNKDAYPLTEALSLRSVSLVHTSLGQAVHNGSDVEARSSMLMACWLAGVAFSQVRLGNVHAMSHPVGGWFNVPHGVANAIILPTVMEFNLPAASQKFADIAVAMGHHATGDTDRDARAAVELVRKLSKSIGIPESLRAVGIPEEGLPALAADAMKSGNVALNPRLTSPEEMSELFRRCW
ncbi:MAG: iron-containing alcohol dehydrogenase [Chloroflexi bacterium]|nr:iron-containing alcohol dehydrogenase [Chloroflexota bacterium]